MKWNKEKKRNVNENYISYDNSKVWIKWSEEKKNVNENYTSYDNLKVWMKWRKKKEWKMKC